MFWIKRTLAVLVITVVADTQAAGKDVPLPPHRLSNGDMTHPISQTNAVAGEQISNVSSKPTPCDKRLMNLADVTLLPRLIGPGACGGRDMVEVEAARLAHDNRIAVKPPAVLTCAMAESLAGWLRDATALLVAEIGSPLADIENYDSYDCRPRNRVPDAKLSEHAHGDAIDVRAFGLADGRRFELTDLTLDTAFRIALRDSACHHFTTVLGPGADAHHNGHIHLDMIQRNAGYRICEWEVREAKSPALLTAAVPLPRPRPTGAGAR